MTKREYLEQILNILENSNDPVTASYVAHQIDCSTQKASACLRTLELYGKAISVIDNKQRKYANENYCDVTIEWVVVDELPLWDKFKWVLNDLLTCIERSL